MKLRRRDLMYVLMLLAAVAAIAGTGLAVGTAVKAGNIDAIESADASAGAFVRAVAICGSLIVTASKGLTYIGLPPWFTLILIVVGVLLVKDRATYAMVYVITTVAGSGLINTIVKRVVDRARPPFERPCHFTAFSGEHWSFPSGHAMTSTVMYGMFAFLLMSRLKPAHRVPVGIVAVLLPLSIGAGRMILGVHYMSDIVAGLVMGSVWLLSSTAAFRKWSGRRWPLDKQA